MRLSWSLVFFLVAFFFLFSFSFVIYLFLLFLVFSSMLSTSYEFAFRVRYHCTYFSFFWIVFFLHPLLLLPLHLFPFSSLSIYYSNMTPPPPPLKKIKPDFVLIDKPGRLQQISRIPYFMGNYSFMLPSANNILENPHLQDFRNII